MAKILQPESFYETTLAQSIGATDSSIRVASAPNVTEGYLVIEAGSNNREIIYFSGVTSTTLTGCVRGLASYGTNDSAGTGKAHTAGVEIANKDVHYYVAATFDFLTGVSASGHNTYKLGDGAAVSSANRYWEFITSSVSAFIGLSSNGTLVVSEDGLTSYVISAGGSGVATGDGVLIAGGTASINALSTGGLEISASKLAIGVSSLIARDANGIRVDTTSSMTWTGNQNFTGQLLSAGNNVVPIGTILMYTVSSAPSGWLICDGTSYDASGANEYSALYNILGNTYGGASISAFNVPDLRTRVVVGLSANATAAWCSAMGYTDGVSAHTLTIDEIPEHTHNYNYPSGGGSGPYAANGTTGNAAQMTTSAGSGGTHNNLQPYIVLNYIIKY